MSMNINTKGKNARSRIMERIGRVESRYINEDSACKFTSWRNVQKAMSLADKHPLIALLHLDQREGISFTFFQTRRPTALLFTWSRSQQWAFVLATHVGQSFDQDIVQVYCAEDVMKKAQESLAHTVSVMALRPPLSIHPR